MRTRIKICGITRPEDARVAADAGADAVGLVFFRGSERYVTVERARAVIAVLPPFVAAVGLFVDADAEEVRAVVRALRIDILQFHGRESPEQCRYDRPYIKAVVMDDAADIRAAERRYGDGLALLLDAHVPGKAGGTGRRFDWSRVPAGLTKPVILAGGLSADNIGDAMQRVRPYAVDVSGGVECATAIKDPEKIRAFIHEVRKADETSR